MQFAKKKTGFSFLSTIVPALLLTVLLFSCSKSVNEKPAATVAPLPTVEFPNGNERTTAVPFEKTIWVSCANNGTGEYVNLTGSTNFVYQMSWTDHGFHLTYHENQHGVTGVGQSTGNNFVGSGHLQGNVTASWVNHQFHSTTVEELRVIGQQAKFAVRYKLHITVNPDSTVAFRHEAETAECR